MARDKETSLAVFADDAIVEDPIGPSHFDPEGKGHRGKEAIAKFFDMRYGNRPAPRPAAPATVGIPS